MFTLRCTQRLLARLKVDRTELAVGEPTTLLGDWYANLLHIGRVQLVLAVSERTFLPVVLPAAPVSSVVTHLHRGVGDVLRALRLDAASIDRELVEMGTLVLGRTASRQVTGILVDFAKGLELYLEHEPSLLTCSVKFAKTPCSPLYKTTVTPESATAALFAQACTGATEVP
ncbi:MAG TPA: hypothetical protein VK745_17535 [Polyangiaceae bacterium]|nr:hypothetical protein [Polyangiaceae bacterium]